MDIYLYGLLGLSLVANAFSVINTFVANSKQRDDENQRTISNIYDELHRRINTEVQILSGKIDSETQSIHLKITELENDANNRMCDIECRSDEIQESIDDIETKQYYNTEDYKTSRKSEKKVYASSSKKKRG